MRCWACAGCVDRYSAALGTWGPKTNMAGCVVSITPARINKITARTEENVGEFLGHPSGELDSRTKVTL